MYPAKRGSSTLLQYWSTYPFHSSSTLDQPKKGQALETQNVNLKQARHPTLDTAGNTGKYRVRFHAPLTSPHHWLPLNLVRKHDGLLDVLHRPQTTQSTHVHHHKRVPATGCRPACGPRYTTACRVLPPTFPPSPSYPPSFIILPLSPPSPVNFSQFLCCYCFLLC